MDSIKCFKMLALIIYIFLCVMFCFSINDAVVGTEFSLFTSVNTLNNKLIISY